MSETQLVFQSDRAFELWDTTPNHKGFLIRSGIHLDLERIYTIDLMFYATNWVCLPMGFKDVAIYLVPHDTQDSDVQQFLSSSGLPLSKWDLLFKLESGGQHCGYISASFLIVLKNRLDSHATPLDCVYKSSSSSEDRGEVLVQIPPAQSRQNDLSE